METQNTALASFSKQWPILNNAAEKINKLVISGDMSLEKAISGKQISTYKREFGFPPIQLLVGAWLLDMAASFNIKNNLDEKQAADIAAKIIKDHWWLKLAEIRLFCEKCKDGYYGQNYQTIDRITVLGWLEKYERESEKYFELHNDKVVDITLHPDVSNALKDAVKDVPIQMDSLRSHLTNPDFKKRYYKEHILPNLEQKEITDGSAE